MTAAHSSGSFGMTLHFAIGEEGTEVRRSLDRESLQGSRLLAAAHSIIQEDLEVIASAWADIHSLDEHDLQGVLNDVGGHFEELLFEPQRVQQYWAELYAAMHDSEADQFDRYVIHVKGCHEYYFYAIHGITDNSTQSRPLRRSPFFERSAPPSKLPADIGAMRGLADTLLIGALEISDRLADPSTDRLVRFLRWFDLQLECRVLASGHDGEVMIEVTPSFEVESPVLRYDPESERGSLLLTSPNVREAVSALSAVWFHPFTRSVLVNGWTGSGKEKLVDLLAFAMRLDERNQPSVSAAALGSFERLETYMQEHRGPLRLGSGLEPRGETRPSRESKTMFFIDEIHHPAATDLRAGMLRLLSSDEIELVSDEGIRVPYSCHHLLYVFASSKPPDELPKIDPKDLWTRIEHTVTLHHPLLVTGAGWKERRQEILRDYFELFWGIHSANWLLSKDAEHTLPSVIREPQFVSELSQWMADKLDAAYLPLISIRILETIVKRLFGLTVNRARSLTIEDPRTLREDFEKWVDKLTGELVPGLTPEKVIAEEGVF